MIPLIPLHGPALPDLMEGEPCLQEIWDFGRVTPAKYTRPIQHRLALADLYAEQGKTWHAATA